MICYKCNAVNGNDDRFCHKCGAPLSMEAPNREDGPVDYATQNATTMIAERDARAVDVKNMRPLTQTAYTIAESEHGSTISFILTLAYILLSLGMVAVLIKIFETISLIGQSFSSSEIEGGLGDLFYNHVTANNSAMLVWLIILFIVMVIGFVFCGRLNIRLKKVRRKQNKEKLDSRL